MSGMGKTVLKKVAGREVICRELTVGDVRQLLAAPLASDLVDVMFQDIQLSDLPTYTSLDKDTIETMHPSDLREVVDGCKEANPDFFAMLARVEMGRNPS